MGRKRAPLGRIDAPSNGRCHPRGSAQVLVPTWCVVAEPLLQPVGGEHRILASVEVPGGYRVECLCGWVSAMCADALAMFDKWAGHIIVVAAAGEHAP